MIRLRKLMKMLVSWFCPLYMGDCLLSLANLPTGFGIWVSRYMDLYISIYILTVLQCSMVHCSMLMCDTVTLIIYNRANCCSNLRYLDCWVFILFVFWWIIDMWQNRYQWASHIFINIFSGPNIIGVRGGCPKFI